uniref:perilipin-3-like n=1 Tax=Euleptes europaea TaxID=460621 RepID=UPI002541B47F|nr:perilipin-3-like [Euleptes europaea]
MASKSKTNLSSPERKGCGQQNILRRVASVPLFSSTYGMAASAYSSAKENHPYVKSFCDVAEKGVKTLTEVAVGSAQPVLTKLEPQIATVSEYASKGLETLEEKLPVLQLTADQVVSSTKGAVSSTMASAKDALANKVSGVVGMTKEAVQGSVDATKSIVSHSLNTVVESRMGQIAAGGAEMVLGRSEKLVDQYLPITSQELAELATNLKEGDVVPLQPQEYLVRLGALSAKLRHRAYQHSLAKIKVTRQSIHSSLSQLQQALDLIEHAKQDVGKKLNESQEKLSQMWLEWSKMNLDAKDETDVAQPEVEAQTLSMFYKIIQQLQATCQTLVSSIQGFPSSLQDKVEQVRQSTGDLHTSFSAVGSFQELSGTLLARSRHQVLKAQGYMDELFDYVVHNTPLSWLVGPFLLCGRPPAEMADSAK